MVTVDHGVRPGSEADAQFVVELAQKMGLPVQAFAPAVRGRSEAALREQRYAVLDALPVDRVALAHHEQDLAETVLIRLLRGTGSVGLAAMRPRRGKYVRPMLGVSREAIVAYARAMGLTWVEDPTNEERIALRNRIRHELTPLLEQIRPGAIRALARSARAAARDDDLLTALLDAEPGAAGPPWSTTFVGTSPEPLVRRALQRTVPGLGLETVDAIRRAALKGSGRIEAPSGVFVVSNGMVSWFPAPPR